MCYAFDCVSFMVQKMESDSEDSIPCTPPEVTERAEATVSNLLPQKSKRFYDKAYQSFMDWRIQSKANSFSENVILAYFADLADRYKSSSLWSYYSMLKAVLKIKHDLDLEKYGKLRAFLKRKSEGYEAKKAKTLTPEEINKFIKEAPDNIYLLHKVRLPDTRCLKSNRLIYLRSY